MKRFTNIAPTKAPIDKTKEPDFSSHPLTNLRFNSGLDNMINSVCILPQKRLIYKENNKIYYEIYGPSFKERRRGSNRQRTP